MVNAQNLQKPQRLFVDTDRLVELGLLDPAFGKQPDYVQGLPQTLNFDPTATPLSPKRPSGFGGPGSFDEKPLAGQVDKFRAEQEGALNTYLNPGQKPQRPELVKPKRITDSQAGIGAGVALLLRALGASDQSVQNAFGSFVSSVVGANQDEADFANQRSMAAYQSVIDDIERTREDAKFTFGALDDLGDDAQKGLDELRDRNAAYHKAAKESGDKALSTLNDLRTKGTLDPTTLRSLEEVYFRATGQDLLDPLTRDDDYASAKRNLRRLEGTRDADAVKAANDAELSGVALERSRGTLQADIDKAGSDAKISGLNEQLKEIDVRIAEATEVGDIEEAGLRVESLRLRNELLEIELKNAPEEYRLRVRAMNDAHANAWSLIRDRASGGGGGGLTDADADKLVESYRKAEQAVKNAREWGTTAAGLGLDVTDTQALAMRKAVEDAKNDLESIKRQLTVFAAKSAGTARAKITAIFDEQDRADPTRKGGK